MRLPLLVILVCCLGCRSSTRWIMADEQIVPEQQRDAAALSELKYTNFESQEPQSNIEFILYSNESPLYNGYTTDIDHLDAIKRRSLLPNAQETQITNVLTTYGGTEAVRSNIEKKLMEQYDKGEVPSDHWIALANTWRSSGDTFKVIQCARQALRKDNLRADAYFTISEVLRHRDLLEDASDILERAIGIKTSVVFIFSYAELLRMRGRYDDSITACKKALQIQRSFYPCELLIQEIISSPAEFDGHRSSKPFSAFITGFNGGLPLLTEFTHYAPSVALLQQGPQPAAHRQASDVPSQAEFHSDLKAVGPETKWFSNPLGIVHDWLLASFLALVIITFVIYPARRQVKTHRRGARRACKG